MDSHKDFIIKVLRMWGELRTSEVLIKLWDNKIEIGANSLTRRLRDLQVENIIESYQKSDDKEKTWKLKLYEKSGQEIFL